MFHSHQPEVGCLHPIRRFAYLLADHIQVSVKATFDDQLIMNVTDDEAVPESLHGIAEDITANSLDDVLHELRAVSFRKRGMLSVRMYTVCASFRFLSLYVPLGGVPRWSAFRYTQKKGSFCQGTLKNFFAFSLYAEREGVLGPLINKKISRPAEKSAKRLSRY